MIHASWLANLTNGIVYFLEIMATSICCGLSFSLPTFDILRVPQVDLDYRYPKYHNFSNQSDSYTLLRFL